MSKKVDWSMTYKGALRGNRGKYGSFGEMLKKAQEQREVNEQKQELFKALEPELRKALLDKMVGKEVILVLQPFNNIAEQLVKSSYGMGYQTVEEQIPAGTKLIYQKWDKTMGQWIFKAQTDGVGEGPEIAIYDKPLIVVENGPAGPQQRVNSAFYGLLTNTNIFQEVLRREAEANEEA